MSQQREIDALIEVVPPASSTRVLLIELGELSNEGAQFSTGWLTTETVYLSGDSNKGFVTLGDTVGEGWLRVDTANGTYFVWNTRAGGGRRYLQRFHDTSINLAGTIQQPDCCWSVSTVPGSSDLRITVGSEPNNALARSAGTACTNPFGSRWQWNDSPLALGVSPADDAITVEAYWWGFHLRVPEILMSSWLAGGLSAGAVVGAIAGATGPAAPFVAAAGAYITAEFNAAAEVDQGNGVYISMSWFAPLVFVPTAI